MKHFLKIAAGLDPWPLLHSLQTQPELWNQYKAREAYPMAANQGIDDILLRYNKYKPGDDVNQVCMELEAVEYPAWYKLQPAQVFAHGMMQKVLGLRLGKVIIARLAPGREIPLHSDRIDEAEKAFPDRVSSAAYYERYHVVLQSAPGVQFVCGDEAVYMAPGEAWWFDNQQLHTVVNNSAEDRIHLVMDIRTRQDDYIPG